MAHAAGDAPPYEAGWRLLRLILRHWSLIDSRLLLEGVDLESLTADRALNVVYQLLIDRMADDPKARREFDESLYRPDASTTKPSDKKQPPSWWIDNDAQRAVTTQRAIREIQGGD